MIDCEKCKYYHDNCDSKFRCRIDVEKIKADAIEEFAEWLPKHFDLRFSNNPQVWVDEYFNHTSEKIINELKESK